MSINHNINVKVKVRSTSKSDQGKESGQSIVRHFKWKARLDTNLNKSKNIMFDHKLHHALVIKIISQHRFPWNSPEVHGSIHARTWSFSLLPILEKKLEVFINNFPRWWNGVDLKIMDHHNDQTYNFSVYPNRRWKYNKYPLKKRKWPWP